MSLLHNWFETKVSYEKLSPEDGLQKKTTEVYLIDAITFAEAEARVIKEVQPFTSGELSVVSIKRKKYYEVFSEIPGINMVDAEANKILGNNKNQSTTADKWYDCKINFIVFDQEKDKQKRVSALMLVNANSPRAANDTLVEKMRGTMSDWELVKIAETPILDIFPYTAE